MSQYFNINVTTFMLLKQMGEFQLRTILWELIGLFLFKMPFLVRKIPNIRY
ncbi:hypothetical protein AL1_18580 [Alistipes shahii WAL 8301]|uniref:Uncharacterized protein n=1 Tax=Alistipes shahii WAL 8301 TaxID=717959 RepID=D4IMR0_9BACT|nr:hypothetical protein AL1_18580 [Alistipes shahii WAL 8301]